EGLWLSPREVSRVCIGVCKQALVGVLRRGAAEVTIVLHLVESDGKVARSIEFTHPMRELASLPQAVAARAGRLLHLDAPPPPVLRPDQLIALGRGFVLAGGRDFDRAATELERAVRPSAAALRFAVTHADLAGWIRDAGEGVPTRVRALLALDPAAALLEARKFSDENPTNVAARFLLARVQIEAGKWHEALQALAPRPGELDAAEAHLLRRP